ncbi:LysR substrate-binding domain-containing protein [Streptomyces sp. NPDC049954]|uniref:LysR substrate-binding domain-containing protein n=1 Tax=Streptomyces sp. NPDC049954 TaxID=3155779 RepID=UPI00342CD356
MDRQGGGQPRPGAHRTLAECGDQPWITATEGTLCRTMTVRACRSAGFVPRTRHRVDDFDTVLTLVAAGQGVALVPESAVEQPPSGVALSALDTVRRTAVAHRAGAGGRPAVAVVAEALRAAVPDALREPAGRR